MKRLYPGYGFSVYGDIQGTQVRNGATTITRLAFPLLTWMAMLALAAPALSDQQYSLAGTDRYQIGSQDIQTQIRYSGTETLTIRGAGSGKHYRVRARYRRSDQTGSQAAQAAFDATLMASGEQRDEYNGDPNYLTVLNQPFSVQLDLATLRDLGRLHGRIPFDFPSPMTGGALHGYLMRGAGGTVAGRHGIGVNFDAQGPMRGPLPDHPALTLSGTMHMHGTAFYDTNTALLLALDATLTITGNLNDPRKATPVSIVYKRSLRADTASPTLKEASAHI